MHEKCSHCYFKDFDVSIAQLINRGLVVSVCVFNLLKTEGTNTTILASFTILRLRQRQPFPCVIAFLESFDLQVSCYGYLPAGRSRNTTTHTLTDLFGRPDEQFIPTYF